MKKLIAVLLFLLAAVWVIEPPEYGPRTHHSAVVNRRHITRHDLRAHKYTRRPEDQ